MTGGDVVGILISPLGSHRVGTSWLHTSLESLSFCFLCPSWWGWEGLPHLLVSLRLPTLLQAVPLCTSHTPPPPHQVLCCHCALFRAGTPRGPSLILKPRLLLSRGHTWVQGVGMSQRAVSGLREGARVGKEQEKQLARRSGIR